MPRKQMKKKKQGSVDKAKAVLGRLDLLDDGEPVKAAQAVTYSSGFDCGLVVSLT